MNHPAKPKMAAKQSTLVFIFNAITTTLILLSVIAVLFIWRTNQHVSIASRARYDISLAAKRFMDGSSRVTDEVRAYAARGHAVNYENYRREIETTRNKDFALARMRGIGITATEEQLVARMVELSDNMTPYEEQTVRLASVGNFTAALEVIYGERYEDWCARIRATEDEFLAILGARTEAEFAQAFHNINLWTQLALLCLAVSAIIQVFSFMLVNAKLIRPLVKVRDEMARIASGDLHSQFEATPDSSEMGTLIHAIQQTKSALNAYIADISEKLFAIAHGDATARITSHYLGDFERIKLSINEISLILTAQRRADSAHRNELRDASEEAKAANKAKSNFLSNMSHEIRTPLNAILGMTNIAMASDDTQRRDHCLHKIADASHHLLGVINDILDMSKIDANKFELSAADCNFEKMMMRVVNIIQFRVDEKRQRLNVWIDPQVPTSIIVDDQRLAQVITNLISNAVKFTPDEGEINVNVQMMEDRGEQCLLQIAIKDSGIGISSEQQGKLFNSFTQAEADISRRFGGSGLGLAISKTIIEKMGGRIWVESILGEGAMFCFEIWVGRGSEVENTRALLEGLKWKDLRVLVVDDDPMICEYFANVADRYAFHCETMTNSLKVVKALQSGAHYDIFFIDWKMPELNGIELSRIIQQHSGNTSVITMISSVEWSIIESEARAAGVTKFVPKPLFTSIIIDCIGEWLGAEMHIDKNVPTKQMPDFSHHHILLAEDIEINQEIVMALLEPTGVRVTCAENGKVALDTFAANPSRFDMIFMDMHMPEMDGLRATAAIRALDDPWAGAIPIVAMTANVFREDVERCLSIGMNDHIGKPLDFDDVLRKMLKYLPTQP